jgi:hypothetical protein
LVNAAAHVQPQAELLRIAAVTAATILFCSF